MLPENKPLQWLKTDDWRGVFPAISTWFDYGKALPNLVLAQLCAAKLGQAPMRAVVEQPWQAQWVLRQCAVYLQQASLAAPLPQVQTLAQWLQQLCLAQTISVAIDATNDVANDVASKVISPRQNAIMLSSSLKALNVDSIHSDGARYALAGEMVAFMAELGLRASLPVSLPCAGQDGATRLAQTPWLSREASWLAAAQGSIGAVGQSTAWQQTLTSLNTLALDRQLVLVLPAPHPSVMMQAFLSALNNSQINTDAMPSVGLPQLCDAEQTIKALADVHVRVCDSFEHEAQTATALVLQAMFANQQSETAQSVSIVAHDRVLARRVAALLARRGIAVEDRVGWALSTTVAATAVRSIVTSWQGSDVQALMAWLALPVVVQHWAGAAATLTHLRRLWHAQAIVPDSKAFIAYALKLATSDGNTPVQTCLLDWHHAQKHFVRPAQAMTVGAYALALMAYLSPLQAALQNDAAGGKVWQQLSALGLEIEPTLVTIATFAAVLDEAFESERFSASTVTHESHETHGTQAAKAVFLPLYEAAWTDCPNIIMVGCNESHLPAKPRNPTPLLASVRFELGLPSPTSERAVWQHLLASVSAKQQTMYATYTSSEQGNPSRLSPWLLGCKVLPATLLNDIGTVTDSGSEIISENIDGKTAEITQETQVATLAAQLGLSALPSEISVTKLAEIVQCPYRFALRSVFRITALDEPSVWPSHLERGNLLHEALHTVRGDLQDLHILNNPEALHSAIDHTLQALVQSKLGLSGRYAALLADTQRTVSTYIATHAARQQEGWRLHATEKELASHTIIDTVRVFGKLDRIDVVRDSTGQPQGYAVIDYKTSSEQTLKNKRDEPLQDAQLALYAALLERHDALETVVDKPTEHDNDAVIDSALRGEPAAQAAYWRLHDGLHDASNIDTQSSDYHDKHTLFTLSDLPTQVNQVADAVRIAWQHLDSNGLAPATASQSACQYCAYKGVCRSSHLAAADGDDSADADTLESARGLP